MTAVMRGPGGWRFPKPDPYVPRHISFRGRDYIEGRSKGREVSQMPESEKTETVKTVGPLSQEELEVAAYFHWIGRGCPWGDPQADWFEVEKRLENEIRSREKRKRAGSRENRLEKQAAG
jgi:hypothetical protein